jgi:hypothetical protein
MKLIFEALFIPNTPPFYAMCAVILTVALQLKLIDWKDKKEHRLILIPILMLGVAIFLSKSEVNTAEKVISFVGNPESVDYIHIRDTTVYVRISRQEKDVTISGNTVKAVRPSELIYADLRLIRKIEKKRA